MERELETMKVIMEEKEKDISKKEIPPLDAEGKKLAEHKRFTFDVIDSPTDPLR